MDRGKVDTRSGEAYRLLKKKLRAGEFMPGERLTEARIVRMLGVGRSSVREALVRLEAEGLLRGRGAYGGKFVGFIEDQDLQDVLHRYELREVVEGLAARLAAKNMTGWQIDELRRLERRIAEAFQSGDHERKQNAGMEFRHYLLANCGNPLLLAVWEANALMPLMARSPETEGKIWANRSDPSRRGKELAPVVDAIAAHDPEEAERGMREIIRRVTEAIRKMAWETQKDGL